MKHILKMKHDNQVMCSVFYGDLSYKLFEQAFLERISHPKFGSIKVLEVDYSNIEGIDYTTTEVKQGVVRTHEATKLNPKLTWIGIVPQKELFGLSRMWMAYAETVTWECHLVHSKEESEELIERIIS